MSKLDLNHIQNFTDFPKECSVELQFMKIEEEFYELSNEMESENRTRTIDEGLDLIVATYNLLSLLNINQDDIYAHKNKLENYRKIKKY